MAAKIKPVTMEHSLEIYIPTQCRCGKPLPEVSRDQVFEEVKVTMAGWFGGASAKSQTPRVARVEGSYLHEGGDLAKEPVDVVQSFADEDSFAEYREDFLSYVAQLANRLTQAEMGCTVDGKFVRYPSAPDPKPHRCAGGAQSGMTPKPREPEQQDRMMQLQAALQRLGGVNDVRHLFCNVLHYDYENGIVPTTAWPDAAKQCLASGVAPQIIADQNGFKVIYLQLATDSLRKSSERQLVQRLIKDNPGMRGLVVVSDIDQKHWNLVNVKFDRDGKNRDKILLRRMRVGPGQPVRTAVERLSQVDVELLGEDASAADLQDKHDKAFDVEAVTKQFFNDVANWYFWALKHVEFPKDAPKEDDGHDHVSLIRLITRLIFCWFLREKGLLPDTLFDRRQLNDILEGFGPDKVRNKDSVYYRAILQNLFFATLSTETDKRKWANDEQNFMAHSLYRFKECFQKPATALNLFKSIPFLNGGLFECLDRDLGEGKKPRYIRIDGFSRRSDSQAVVPDFLFFGPEREIDLSDEYGGDRRFRNVRVRGLIDTLRHYNFTIEENTPIEEEVALDPELCGKVFENLLAAYNPETGKTARKQSGSFYTPREIVNYMVDETLIASLTNKLEATVQSAKDIELRLRHLFAYNDEPHQFDKKETKALIAAIDRLKTLDPAVGSGAFPMGLLHKLVFILGKLDKNNAEWKERQISRVRDAIKVAEKIEDDTIRSRTIEDLEAQIANVEESFARNELDYGRKLYLIENCIYGVDIQPIAVQIAKMRFFISLIVDQKINDNLPNRGVRPLPNLETKFVAANTLIGIDRPGQQLLRNREIDEKEAELRNVREKHFLARSPKQKAKCREADACLRSEIAGMLKDDGWDTATASKLASWNPYDQNASALFFDPEWMFGIADGFDVVIGNPPYVQVKKGVFSREQYPWSEGKDIGKQNLYKVFLEAARNFSIQEGFACMIVQSSLMADLSSARTREMLLTKTKILTVIEFPKIAPTRAGQVFESVLQGTCICIFQNKSLPNNQFSISCGNDVTTVSCLEFEVVKQTELVRFRPNSFEIPLFKPQEFDIYRRLFTNSVALISLMESIEKGDLNLGTNAPSFSQKISQMKLYRGRNIRRYGMEESVTDWVKPGQFLEKAKKNSRNCLLVCQEITGTVDPRRLIFTMINKPNEMFLFGDTVQKVILEDQSDAKFVIGILNSKLMDWCFRKTSTNNHVGGYELEALPFPSKIPGKSKEAISALVDRLLVAIQKNPAADTAAFERKIDELVYALYGLTAEEIKIVEEATA